MLSIMNNTPPNSYPKSQMNENETRLKPMYFVYVLLVVAIAFFTVRLIRRNQMVSGTSAPLVDGKTLSLHLAGRLTQIQAGQLSCEPEFTKKNANDPPGFERFVSLVSCESTDGRTVYNLVTYASEISSASILQTQAGLSCTPATLEKLYGLPASNIKAEIDGARGVIPTSILPTPEANTPAWPRDLVVTASCRTNEPGVFRLKINTPAAAITLQDLDIGEGTQRNEPLLLQPVKLISDVINVEVGFKKEKDFDKIRAALISRRETFVLPALEKALAFAKERNYPTPSIDLIKKVNAQVSDDALMSDQLQKNISTMPKTQ
jgi:hypothetical protein